MDVVASRAADELYRLLMQIEKEVIHVQSSAMPIGHIFKDCIIQQ
jgi:hypothetical protein